MKQKSQSPNTMSVQSHQPSYPELLSLLVDDVSLASTATHPALSVHVPLQLEERLEGHRLARAHLGSPFSTKKLNRL